MAGNQTTQSSSTLTWWHKSRQEFTSYPRSLAQTDELPYRIKGYVEKLNSKDDDGDDWYFHKDHCQLFLWSLQSPEDSYKKSANMRDLPQTEKLLSESEADPCSRFLFMQSYSHRSPLSCSKEQMAFVLTHYQIMAAFLNFVFTYYHRDSVETLTAFRYEDFLHGCNAKFALQDKGRSGIRLQHCFNLISVEYDPSHPEAPWPLRNTVLCHSFDLVEGNAFWISLKGNGVLENRITESTEQHSHLKPEMLSNLERKFLATLTTHLILFQWCVEGWPGYIEWLEEKVKPHSVKVQYTGLARETEPEKVGLAVSRRGTGIGQTGEGPSRKGTAKSEHGFQPQRIVREFSGRLFDKKKPAPLLTPPIPEARSLNMDEMFNFTELQDLSRRENEIHDVLLVVEQDICAMNEVLDRYKALMASPAFTKHIHLQDHHQATANFFTNGRRFVRDMETSARRLNKVACTLQNAKNQFFGILQYRNMRTGEYFALNAHISTKTMEEIALKTKQETLSMHAVTILTLLFLPSTFVAVRVLVPFFQTLYRSENPEEAVNLSLADPDSSHRYLTPSSSLQTLFSSGVMNWDEHGDGGTPRIEAVKLFLKVAIPITAFVFGLWLIWYLRSKRQNRGARYRFWEDSIRRATSDEKNVGLKTA